MLQSYSKEIVLHSLAVNCVEGAVSIFPFLHRLCFVAIISRVCGIGALGRCYLVHE